MSMDLPAGAGFRSAPRGFTWERACFVFVLLVWLQCLIATQVYIAYCASSTPVADDLALFYVKAKGVTLGQYLWSLHNEHRLPLPKLIQYLLYDWTKEIRTGMFLQAQLYAATALACILVARRLRGGSRIWDIFFPLMWLQLGNSENLLMGFQLCIAIPGACVCSVLFLGALSERRLWPSRAFGSGLALFALPLCGGGGLLQAPFLALWSAWLGWTNRNHPDARERRGARIHLGFALATVALCGLYLIGFERPPTAHYTAREHPPWKLALENLCAPFGPDYMGWQPVLAPAIALGALLLAFAFLRRGWRERDPRALGALAVMAGAALMVLGIGFGRPINGPVLVANRYIPLPAPFFVAATLGALALLAARWREVALFCACVLMLVATPRSIHHGEAEGLQRRARDRQLATLVETHANWATIQSYYSNEFVLGMTEIAEWLLRYYADNGLPPFDHAARFEFPPTLDYPSFESTPIDARFLEPPVNRTLDDLAVCVVAPPTTFAFAVVPGQHHFHCEVGVPALLLRSNQHPGVRARVRLRPYAGQARDLGQIKLDPQHSERDRGLQPFEFEWGGGVSGVLELNFEQLFGEEGRQVADRVAVRKARLE